jgi:long-subunit acyl-CoA synthetase (AMP-forming)
MSHQTPIERFLEMEKNFPNKNYLHQPLEGEYVSYTVKEIGQQARTLAKAIKSMELPEKSNIALMSKKLCSLDNYRYCNMDERTYFGTSLPNIIYKLN